MKGKILFLLPLLLSGCGGKSPDVAPTLPDNLQVNVTVSEDGTGKIALTATANNTNYFDIYFGDVTNEQPLVSKTGTETHTYTASGTYTVTVEAHATTTGFVTKSETVDIALPVATDGYITPETYDGMTLVWQDEFDGSTLNASDWNYETGGGGWGNNELETYTTSNASVGDGYLVITAKKDGANYTSSRINTKDKHTFQYGRIDIRARLPKGQGMWPALWMLGSDFPSVGWPQCGEIDIMEMIGGSGREKTDHGTPHWFDNGHASFTGQYDLPSGTLADKFHVFSLVWTSSKISWYIDDIKFHDIDTTPATLDEFRATFYFIFNVAVGGDWPGNPDNTTVFPQSMTVDYVRVFQPN